MARDEQYRTILKLAQEGRIQESRKIILREIKENPHEITSGGRNIVLACYLILAGDWGLVKRLFPQNTSFFHVSGWLRSLFSRRPIDAEGEAIPWLTYPAIDFLEPRLGRDWAVFEYGSGNSTPWWSKRVGSVHAVEDDKTWYDTCRRAAGDNVTVEYCPEEASYVSSIARSANGPFDMVVIDGKWRNACADRAQHHIKPDGIIVYDNSDVPEHADGLRLLSKAGWLRLDFFGLAPCYPYKNCTSILFRDAAFLRRADDALPSDVALTTGIPCGQAMHQNISEAKQTNATTA